MSPYKIKLSLFASVFCLAIFYSCSKNPIIPPPVPFPVNELVDRSVNPGDDFYSYCNGTWIKNNPLPPGQSSKAYWIDPQYGVESFQKVILESGDEVVNKLLSDIDKRDVSADAIAQIQEKTRLQLQEIDNLKTLKDVMVKVGRMSMKGYKPILILHSQPVERRVQIVVEVIDNMPQTATAQAWKMMTGCTDDDAKALAKTCAEIQDEFLSNKGIAIRTKPYKGNEIVEGRKFMAEAVGVPVERMIYGETIDQDDFMKSCVTEAQMEKWKMVLKNSIVSFNYKWTFATKEELAAYLSEGYQPLTYRMTKLYSDTYRDAIMRDFTIAMVEEIREAFIDMIQTNDWLAGSTRQTAMEKARKLDSFVGYPDNWQSERLGSVPSGSSLLEDMEQIGEQWWQIVQTSINDTPTRDDMWYSLSQAHTAPYHMNAMNTTESNGLYIYIPMLLPRACRGNVPDAYNYGMVGAVIGHELGHGFDTAGYQFGIDGEWNEWWTAQDKENFFARTHKLAAHFSKYRPFPEKYPDFYANGEQTSVEDVADLNGLNAAFRAMVKHYAAKGASESEMLQAKREFFLAYGNLWCGVYSEDYIINRILTNIHSISVLRINGIVSQMDEWYDAYDIKAGDKMYIAPSERVKIWNK